MTAGWAGRLLPRPWTTLRGRIALAALAGLVAASVVFALVGTSLLRTEAERVARGELDRQAVNVAGVLGEQAQAQAERGEELDFLRVLNLERILGPGTRIYVDSLQLSPGAIRPYDTFPRVAEEQLDYGVLEREGVQRLDFTRPSGVVTEASAAPITIEGFEVGAILVTRPPSVIGADRSALAVRVALAAALGLVVALALVLFLTARLTRPLRAMRLAARRVGRGDRRVTLRRTGAQELDEVGQAFNAMVRALAASDATSREFLMRVTHDLRTPLTAIRGHASALADGVVPPEDVPRSLAAVQSEAARLEGMVADLLDLARLDARRFRLNLAEVEPLELLETAADALEAEAAARGIDYRRDLEQVPPLLTDELRVRQIVSNLLENALRWTPPGGSVRLSGGPRPGGGLVVVVADSGPGVADSEREAVFEPFQARETPDGRQGSGLGLAISRQLARALGGDVRVESREGAGSRFTLELPAESAQLHEAVTSS